MCAFANDFDDFDGPNVLKANGSPRAIVVTDDERTFFRITILCHVSAGNIIADIATREKSHESSQEIGQNIPDVLKEVLKKLTERQIDILEL